ncbi:hypothetical protein F8C76_11245 [Flagellimonas olearia]|uniref:Uncharacterized protein n=1 Tax=Flagellimonas olearia TaxID=552546 RepID=A0A6I1DX76_9FLAO|nr:hypothetical protein [Allomuricauda olearia]KAB7528431.1 hypothetical protein F8C76_11245 [Allomuricauda olearia]
MNKFIVIPPKHVGLNDWSDFSPDYFNYTLILKKDERCNLRGQWVDWSKGYDEEKDKAGGLKGHYLKYRGSKYVEFNTFEEARALADIFDAEYSEYKKGNIKWGALSFNSNSQLWVY